MRMFEFVPVRSITGFAISGYSPLKRIFIPLTFRRAVIFPLSVTALPQTPARHPPSRVTKPCEMQSVRL